MPTEAFTESALKNIKMTEEWKIILEKVNQLESNIAEVQFQAQKTEAVSDEIMSIDNKVAILSVTCVTGHKRPVLRLTKTDERSRLRQVCHYGE